MTSIVFIIAFFLSQNCRRNYSLNDANPKLHHLDSRYNQKLRPKMSKNCSIKIYAKQKDPEHHSFSTLLATSFNPKPSNSLCTIENSAARMPASTKVPSRRTCAAIFFFSAINRLEIRLAHTSWNF